MNINNEGHLKIALLAEGVRISEKAKEKIGDHWLEKIYSYSLTDWTDEKQIFPSDIILGGKVVVGFRFNPNSRWLIEKDKDIYIISDNVSKNQYEGISYSQRPKYYDNLTGCGASMQSIGVSCGNHGISFFVNNYCEYFKDGQNCRFCSLVPSQSIFSETKNLKSVNQVKHTIKKILEIEDPLDFIQLSGGSFYNHDREVRNYLKYIEVIKNELINSGHQKYIPIHLTSMPPKDLSLLKKLKSAGLDTISFDLECPTENYFRKYCPGKQNSYGYSQMRKALEQALGVFGQGNVYTIVILGIEPPELFIQSIKELAESGIIPTINIYHYDPLIQNKMDVKFPDTELLISAASELAKTFSNYNIVPGKLGCAHYDIGNELKNGYFN